MTNVFLATRNFQAFRFLKLSRAPSRGEAGNKIAAPPLQIFLQRLSGAATGPKKDRPKTGRMSAASTSQKPPQKPAGSPQSALPFLQNRKSRGAPPAPPLPFCPIFSRRSFRPRGARARPPTFATKNWTGAAFGCYARLRARLYDGATDSFASGKARPLL